MRLIIDHNRCTGCGVCARVCPQRILYVADKKLRVTDEGRCMGCFGCEDECPAGAVRVLRCRGTGTDIPSKNQPSIPVCCDVAVVGAGPAGLGAAITCAKAGLEVVVCERLPNRRFSHHPDGGLIFAFPGMTSLEVNETGLSFPELALNLPVQPVACRDLTLVGPDGLATGSRFPAGLTGWALSKDAFVQALADRAEQAGARLLYATRVTDVLRQGERVHGIRLDTGETIHAKVVVAADGVMAKFSAKAGMPISRNDPWYASVLALEFDLPADLPAGLHYLNGGFDFVPGNPAFGAVSITRSLDIVVAVLSRDKFYPANQPLEHYAQGLLTGDPRVKHILDGRAPLGEPKLNGCRSVFRARSNTHTVGHGVVSVGDAWVDSGELGNIPALANGVHAGRVIVQAAQTNDFSANALQPAAGFASKKLVKALAKNKQMKLLATRLNAQEMKQLFLFMRHINYPVLLLGSSWQKSMMFAGFMLKSLPLFFKYPKIAKLLF